jgi:hypothetical protein
MSNKTMHPKIKACIDSCVTISQLTTCLSFARMNIKNTKLFREIMDYITYKQKVLTVCQS